MKKRRRPLLYAATGVVVVAVGAFALAYFVLFPTDSPDKFTLSEATPSATAGATAAAGGSQWTVAEGSEAGYRVREKLAFLAAKNDAVGRTSDITGTAESDGDTFSKADFKIDLTTLTSDQDRRDQRIREIGVESDRFPTATLSLTEPVDRHDGAERRRVRERRGRSDARVRPQADPQLGVLLVPALLEGGLGRERVVLGR